MRTVTSWGGKSVDEGKIRLTRLIKNGKLNYLYRSERFEVGMGQLRIDRVYCDAGSATLFPSGVACSRASDAE